MNRNEQRNPNAVVSFTAGVRDTVAQRAGRILHWFRLPNAERGTRTIQALRPSDSASIRLEHALSSLRDELGPRRDVRLRIFVTGQPKRLSPGLQEQIYLIGREAMLNAMRHAQATNIEADIEYLPRGLRLAVRDNGCGIDPQIVRSQRNSYWGLLGMRDRAGAIGARFRIWSRPGAGTEVEVSVPDNILTEAFA
jgi:signal transduction histidine kinase